MTTYKEVKVKNGQLKPVKTYTVNQNQLTSDCWLIQFKGLSACTTCELRDTSECGGGQTLKQLQTR